jgi:hypothetical protein
MTYVRPGALAIVGLLAASCGGGSPPPHARVASSEAALRSAREVGAQQVPQANLYLDLAQNEFERGRALMKGGQNREADEMLQRAQADAELALATTREAQTRAAAEQTKARVQALRAGMPPGSAVGGGPTQGPTQPPTGPTQGPTQPPTQGPMQGPTQPGQQSPQIAPPQAPAPAPAPAPSPTPGGSSPK